VKRGDHPERKQIPSRDGNRRRSKRRRGYHETPAWRLERIAFDPVNRIKGDAQLSKRIATCVPVNLNQIDRNTL
jgi:hypothetical protein